MFINYSTLIPNTKFNEDIRLKREINYLRVKCSELSEQPYEATTVNSSSYISTFFKEELEEIYTEFSLYDEHEDDRTGLDELEKFIKWHSKQLESKRIPKRKSCEHYYPRTKEKEKRGDLFGSTSLRLRDSTEKASSVYSIEHT